MTPTTTKYLFLPCDRPIQLKDHAAVEPAMKEFEQEVRLGFHNLHQKRAPCTSIVDTNKGYAHALVAARTKIDQACKEATKRVAKDAQEQTAMVIDALYYDTLFTLLCTRAEATRQTLIEDKANDNMYHLKQIVEQCDGLRSDTTKELKPKTDEARVYVALTAYSFTKHEEIPDPLPLAALNTEELPHENDFRTGTSLAKVPLIGYRKILPTVDYLRSIALRLCAVEADFHANIRRSCSGNNPLDALLYTRLDELDGLLTRHFEVIRSKPRSGSLHAGWYYLMALQAQSPAIRASMCAFKEMQKGTFGIRAQIIEKLGGNLFALYQAAMLAQTEEPSLRNLQEILGRDGHERLALTDEEKAVPKRVFANQQVPDALLQSYLMKSLVKQSYFAKYLNAELDLVVCKIDHHPLFQTNPELAAVYAAYLAETGSARRTEEIDELVDILSLLYNPSPDGTPEECTELNRFMSYCAAHKKFMQLCLTKRGPRINYLEKALENEREKAYDFQKEPTELFSHLYTYFFIDDSFKRDLANGEILAAIEKLPDISFSVKALLYAWAVERLVERSKSKGLTNKLKALTLSSAEKQLMASFLSEYHTDAAIKAFFDTRYGQEYMQKVVALRPK